MTKKKITQEEAENELKKNEAAAKEILADSEKLDAFLLRLEQKLKVVPGVGDILAIVPTMISLLRSYSKKEYTQIPMGTLIAIVSALIYFLSPIDLIPDSIPGFGQLDDAAVIIACLKWVKDDIEEYERWREENKEIPSTMKK